jgi:hypothetical protein
MPPEKRQDMKVTDDMLIQFQNQNVAGLPRPLGRSYDGVIRPVPYTQSGTNWGAIDSGRKWHGMDESLCLICGDPVEEGFVLWNVVDKRNGTCYEAPELTTRDDLGNVRCGDNGPLHDRCLKMTRAHCQSVRWDLARELTVIVPYVRTRATA